MLCAQHSGRHIVRHSIHVFNWMANISLRKNTKQNRESPSRVSLGRFPQYAKWWSGQNNDTSTLNYLCRYAWVYVWEEKQRCRSSSLFFCLHPHPRRPLIHTLDLVRDEALGGWGGKGELCVKCLLEMHCGVFSCMGNHLCQAFPHFPYLSHLVSCLRFQLCVILFASCTKADFFPKSKDWAHLTRCLCVWLNFSLNLFVTWCRIYCFKNERNPNKSYKFLHA